MSALKTRFAAAAAALVIGFASPAMATGSSGLRGLQEESGSASRHSNTAHSYSQHTNTPRSSTRSANTSTRSGARGHASASGGAGGSSVGTGGHAAGGAATNANSNSANNSAAGGHASADGAGSNNGNNNSSSSNSQHQSQTQSLSNQSETSNANNSSQDVAVNTYNQRAPVNTAFAAPLVTGEDTCMGSSSMGAQAVTFGLSLGTTWRDANCRRLKNSRQMVALGYADAATALMCVDRDVREAMEEAGTPCPSRAERGRQLTALAAAATPVAPAPAAAPACAGQDFVVYFAWDRAQLTREAGAVVDAAAERARQCDVSSALVIGHTDTSGSTGYNVALSRRRAAVVRDALISRGIDAGLIRTDARGETELARTTRDGVREPDNRRTAVTISFR